MKRIILFTALAVLVLSPVLALADDPNVVDTADEVEATIVNIGDWIFRIFMILAVVMLVISAFQFLLASGDPDKFTTAKRSLVYTAVAVAVAVLSSGIVNVIEAIVKKSA
jgi:magnesium-transporting ATPase (P-type)